MSTRVALLRAVNVAGHGKVKMADLREALGDGGYGNVRSLVQTGNLVFDTGGVQPEKGWRQELERSIERLVIERLEVETEVMIRTPPELAALVGGNPFPEQARTDPARLLVVFLKAEPGRDEAAALEAAIRGRERVRVRGRHAYVAYPDGIGRSKLTLAVVERSLGIRGTGRNWNTVTKLEEMAR